MEYRVVIGWDAAQQVYRVLQSEIEGAPLAAATKDALIAAISEAATTFLKQAPDRSGAVCIYEDVGQDAFGQAA